jgi:alpha-tubulin suppressor-like RCC1 family protein
MCSKAIIWIIVGIFTIFSSTAIWAQKMGWVVGWGGQVVGVELDRGFIAVDAGGGHGLGLKEDGLIVAWGHNNKGQCNILSPNTGFVAVSAGGSHNLGLKEDGSIVAWGSDGYGQCNVPSPNTGFVAVAAGGTHSLGLKPNGSIVAWGWNDDGQCNVPSPNTDFVAIEASSCHSLGLKADGSIVAWGSNEFGQCNVPSTNTDFVAVRVGTYHSLGLKADGSIVAWGWNDDGQCNVPSPNTGFIAIAAGFDHSMGLKANGSIVAWGDNRFGESKVPSPNTGFVAIAASVSYSLGLKEDGSIVAWGLNDYGQCNGPSPNSDIVAIAASDVFSQGLKADGSIVSWGHNSHGVYNVPPPSTDFEAISVGHSHSLGLKTDGSVVAWGWNKHGQCEVPSPNTDFVAVAAGFYHSLGLKADDSIVAWGGNYDGQCDVPSPNTGFVAIAAGDRHSLAVKSDGSIVAWGFNQHGQCNVPFLKNTGFVAVAGGEDHSLGLKADSSIVAWGYNLSGRCRVPSPNTGFVAIAAGEDHSLGLKANGSIATWGWNRYGQCNVPSPNTGFIAIAAGWNHSLAIKQAPGPPPDVYHVNALNGNDNYDGSSPDTAFATIQRAIDSTGDGDTVLVYPGVYTEEIVFLGKAITIQGVATTDGVPVLQNPDDFAVSLYYGEGPDSILKNFVIKDSFMAIFIAGSSPTITNVTIVNNKYGIEAYAGAEPDISNCIFWNNTNEDLFGCQAAYSWVQDEIELEQLEGLTSYWGFNEDTGNVAFDPIGGNHGTIYGGASRTEGISGGAFQFDGVDDYVDCIIDEPLQMMRDVSLSVWIKPEDHGIVLTAEGGPDDFGGPAGNVTFYLKVTHRHERDIILYIHEYSDGINEQHDFDPVPLMIWTHIVVVRDISKRTVCIYYNGELIDVFNYLNQPYNPSNQLHITIGSRSTGIEAYKGTIDEVALFDKVLSLEEIQTLYSTGLAGKSLEGAVANDPIFVDPDHSDYHLKSERGRHWPAIDMWVLDSVTSPCIDSGDPTANLSSEPMPNGGRINMGAYGGTPYASMSEMVWLDGDINHDGMVDMIDFAMLADNWLRIE